MRTFKKILFVFCCVHEQKKRVCLWENEREDCFFFGLHVHMCGCMSKYNGKTNCIAVEFLISWLEFIFLEPLTCVCEAVALIGPRGVAVELQPQAIGRAIDDKTHYAIMCKVSK